MAVSNINSLHDWSLEEEINNPINEELENSGQDLYQDDSNVLEINKDTISSINEFNPQVGDGEQILNLSGLILGSQSSNYTDQILELSDDDNSEGKHHVFNGSDNNIFGEFENDFNNEEESLHKLERNPLDGLPYSSLYYELLGARKQLPIWRAKDDFVMAFDESQVVLVTGNAGTGKSTQIPQWCVHFAKDMNTGSVLCSQPSSLAAISLANQIAREMDMTSIGNEVGYKVPFAECCSEETILKFSTDRTILREMTLDPLLERYNIIILDEIQQRTVATDILLSLLRLIIYNHRNDLKLILVSLPHEMPKLEEFFDGVPVVDLTFLDEKIPNSSDGNANTTIDARNDVIYTMDSNRTSSYMKEAVNIAIRNHCDQSLHGDILIFMPSSSDISEVCEMIAREVAMKSLRSEAGEADIVALHSRLPLETPRNLYEVYSNNGGLIRRKIVVADKIAESSFSLNNICTVIDSGRIVVNNYNCRIRARSYALKFISKTSANIRKLRCKPGGKVYRLYSSDIYKGMIESFPSDINNRELTGDVLLMKRLLQQLGATFNDCQLLDPPAPDAYMQALEDLDYHGALDDTGQLSDLGAVMSELPLSLRLAKSVIASCGECCTEEIATLAAMLASPNCFSTTRGSEVKRNSIAIEKFRNAKGDHFTLINIFNEFILHRQSEKWCKDHNLCFYALQITKRIRDEINDIMDRLELPRSPPVKDNNVLEKSVTRALLAGFFMQIARDTDGSGNYLIIRDKHVARLNPGTCLESFPEWVLFNEFVLSDNSYLHTTTAITEELLAEIAPLSYLSNLPDSEIKRGLIEKAEHAQGKVKDDNEYQPTTSGDSPQNKPQLTSSHYPGKIEPVHKGAALPLHPQYPVPHHIHRNTLLDHASEIPENHLKNHDQSLPTFRGYQKQKVTKTFPRKNLHGARTTNVNCVSNTDNGDIDILSQTARELKYAYDQASNYYNTASTDESCVIH